MEPGQIHETTIPSLNISNPRNLIASLITSISTNPSSTPSSTTTAPSQNPLKTFPPQSKNAFLTLYAIFEKELLPALDVLDRNLVTHLTSSQNLSPGTSDSKSQQQELDMFLVRSAQQHHTRHGGTSENINIYEVRLKAWNCSCPAFAFSAFPAANGEIKPDEKVPREKQQPDLFGGLSLGQDLPVCKHILACILGRYCAGFEGFIQEQQVSKEELAGWTAGWGGE